MMSNKVKLGDKVKDSVTGFIGIVTTVHSYLNGCNRMSVQPSIKPDGTIPDFETFDEPQLTVVQDEVVKEGSKETGGPEHFMPKEKNNGSK